MDVPYEYQEMEMVEKEVVKEEVVERRIPQVKCLYNYKGQGGITTAKGEVSPHIVCYSVHCTVWPDETLKEHIAIQKGL